MPSLPVQRLSRLPDLTRFSMACVLVCASLVLLSACDDDTTNDNTNTTGEDTRVRPSDTNSTSTTDAPTATTDSTSGAVDTSGGLPDVTQGCAACEAPFVCVEDWCVLPVGRSCDPGATDVCYNDSALMTCDDTGTAYIPESCFPNHLCTEGACRPIVCDLGVTYCDGDNATHACNSDRTGFLPSIPCPDGLLCTEGVCASSECRPDPKLGSYVGCVYWSADLPVWPDPAIRPTNPQDLPHALVISNPNPLEATIVFAAPPGYIIDNPNPVIPPMQSRVFEMPVISLDGTGIFAKGIGIGSNRPVLVHQFNPWEAVWSNDASLLLPETFLGREYVVHSWPTDPRGLLTIPGFPPQPNVNSFFSVLAPSDDTQVTITVTAPVKAGPGGVLAMTAGTSQTVTLNRGEVLNIEAEPANLFDKADLTGSFVSASKPVAVFAGHESAAIGPEDSQESICCLDHLEEQMLPFAVLGTEYLAVKTSPRGSEPDVWRIVAAEDNVTLTSNPPQQNANNQVLAKRGDWVEVSTADSFELTATGKVQVGQYLWSQQVTDDFTGDPSLILAVPSSRFRTFYVLTVPQGYDTNWVTVIKPVGSTVEVDGVPANQALFQTFASGRYERGYIELSPGVHQLEGDLRFGLVAYGFNTAVSYGYTGGLSGADEP